MIKSYTTTPLRPGHLANVELRGSGLRAWRRWMLATQGLTDCEERTMRRMRVKRKATEETL